MNAFPSASISLCHFCENHGPRIILCTQAVPRATHDSFSDKSFQSCLRHNQRSNLPWNKIAEMTAAAPNRLQVLSVTDCHKEYDKKEDNTEDDLVFGSWDRKVEFVDEEERCDACSSVTENGVHIANDYRAERSYISTEQPLNDECYMITKKALFRAMIAEKMDSATENNFISALSPAFDLRTINRSNKSKTHNSDYNDEGILLFWNDEDCYTAIARTFIVKDAKSRGFRRRYMLLVTSRNRELLFQDYDEIVNELNTTAKLIQIAARRIYKIEQTFDKSALRTAKWMPQEFFKNKMVLDTTRSLTILVGNDDAFYHIHRDFVSILQRMFMYELNLDPPIPSEIDLTNRTFQYFLTFQAFKDMKIVQNSMNSVDFKTLIWHICTGGQVVVQSGGVVPRKQLLFALTILLPMKCVKFEPNASSYIPSGTVNFLGIDTAANWPLDAEDIFVFSIESKKMNLSSELFNANVITKKVPIISKEMKTPTIIQRYLQIFNCDKRISLESQFLLLTNEKMSHLEAFELTNSNQIFVDNKKFLKSLNYNDSDYLIYQFWISSVLNKPIMFFKLSTVYEDEYEDYTVDTCSLDSLLSSDLIEDELIIEITEKLSKIRINDSTHSIAQILNNRELNNKLVR